MSSWREARPQAAEEGSQFQLRSMRYADLRAVMRVERAAYEFPWTEGIFRDCLRVGYFCKVAEEEGHIVGHGIMSMAVGECHILNVCVHPDHQRQGLGQLLLSYLLGLAQHRRAHTALLEVRRSNVAAYALYDKLGFNEIGIRKDYYPSRDGREDALVLARDL